MALHVLVVCFMSHEKPLTFGEKKNWLNLLYNPVNAGNRFSSTLICAGKTYFSIPFQSAIVQVGVIMKVLSKLMTFLSLTRHKSQVKNCLHAVKKDCSVLQSKHSLSESVS